MCDSVIKRDPVLPEHWSYDYGVVFKGMEQVWLMTGNIDYYNYIKRNMDQFLDNDGNIKTYSPGEYNIDHINNGKLLLLLYKQTGEMKYKKAAYLLRSQLDTHPRTSEGGFWHKAIYPHQMWLDGLYMGAPFYAEFAELFHEPGAFDDVANQFILMNRHGREPKTGLLYHGWDESREQKWANKETGVSPNFWGRSLGWFSMAIMDTLDFLPESHKDRKEMIDIVKGIIGAILSVQDQSTGLWYQVLDQGARKGNYLEASASCMFLYAIIKAVRKGYMGDENIEAAMKAYKGIGNHFVEVDSLGDVNLKSTCMVAGLGGIPYRDGTYDYYINAPVKYNDLKGIGAFILGCSEIENYFMGNNGHIRGQSYDSGNKST
jgi:unsaturated rhamnogalacturonyl hydrolase